MQFVNRTKLQTSMLERGLKIKDIAEELCVKYSCAYNKIKGFRDFNENELVVINRLFGSDVFFLDNDVRNLRKKYGRSNHSTNKSS